MSNEKLYAIIDGASEEELMPMLAELDPPAVCLYAPPVQPDLVDIAPYVVLVTEEVQEWLNTRETPWGIYITTDADLKSIRSHLRKYLYVLLPDSDQPVFFRFYDPRNIWLLTSALTDWELHSFMGPIMKMASSWDGVDKEQDFAEQRKEFPIDSISRSSMLSLSEEQYEHLHNVKRAEYIQKLAALMADWNFELEADKQSALLEVPKVYTLHYHKAESTEVKFPTEVVTEVDWVSFASDMVYYLSSNDINNDRSIRGIAQLLVQKKISNLSDLPPDYSNQFERTDLSGLIKVDNLLESELGFIPV